MFIPMLLIAVWVLNALPPPTAQDEAERVRRAPMTSAQRGAFLKAYAPGLAAVVIGYIMLTAIRDYRDNFAAELWKALGFGGEASIFSASELPVAVIALVAMAAVMVVRDNRRALMAILGLVALGFALIGLSTLAFQAHLLSPLVWMILAGSGLYIAYNPINAVLFDRMVAASGRTGNAGFLIYVADSCGYMGSVVVLLWRNFGAGSIDWLRFFILGAYISSAAGVVLTILAAVYFHHRSARPLAVLEDVGGGAEAIA